MNNQIQKYSYLPLQIVVVMGWSLLGLFVFLVLPFLVNQSLEMNGYQLAGLTILNALIVFFIIFIFKMKTIKGLFFAGAIPVALLAFVHFLLLVYA